MQCVAYHGPERDGGQGVVEDGDGVENETDAKAREGEEGSCAEHGSNPVLACTQVAAQRAHTKDSRGGLQARTLAKHLWIISTASAALQWSSDAWGRAQ